MITSLVGYTGFVGSNLASKHLFTNMYNSKNIIESFGTEPDLLIYAGVSAEKYIANNDPQRDLAIVQEAFKNIRRIKAKSTVLISTIDVYKNPVNVDEDSIIETVGLHPYGLNRYYLEQWVENEFSNSLIIRLPGLYCKNIKKNFIYDLIHIIPKKLNKSMFGELWNKDSRIEKYYMLENDGFYKCKNLSKEENDFLMNYFTDIGFTALNFTDSRGRFQFYNLENLWTHINIALENGIHKLNLATEPIGIQELYEYIKKNKFNNEISSTVPNYDYRTKYAGLFGGENGYIFKKDEMLKDIKNFVEGYVI